MSLRAKPEVAWCRATQSPCAGDCFVGFQPPPDDFILLWKQSENQQRAELIASSAAAAIGQIAFLSFRRNIVSGQADFWIAGRNQRTASHRVIRNASELGINSRKSSARWGSL
ncbi:MAG: hypothetical protein U0X92_02095 [Anaerolineales bacterium]